MIKACCAIAAFILWLYIYNVENPVLDKNITVPVSIVNQQVLTQMNLAPVIEDKITLKITVRGKVSDINNLKEKDFDLRADLSAVAIKKGENKIPVIIENKPSSIKITNADNLFVYINIDNMAEKKVPLNIILEGKVREGYYALQPETEYKEVTVKGAQKLIDKIKYGVIRYDISDAYKNIYVDSKVQAESSDGIAYKYVIVEPANIDFTIQIKKTKKVPVNVQISGNLQDYGISSILPLEDSIEIAGDEPVLQNITAINTEAVMLKNLNGMKTVNAKLMIPDGIITVGNISEIKLNVMYSDTVSKTMMVPVKIKNLSGSLNAILEQNTVKVNVSGTTADISNLDEDNINCYLDLNGLGEGKYEIPVKLEMPEGISELSISPENIVVKLEKK